LSSNGTDHRSQRQAGQARARTLQRPSNGFTWFALPTRRQFNDEEQPSTPN
jgi:hypothetical protein